MMTQEAQHYRRRTVRKVDALVHITMPGRPNGTACGCWNIDYDPAPTVFNRGDVRPDRVTVPCPWCAAAVACMSIDKKIQEQHPRRRTAA